MKKSNKLIYRVFLMILSFIGLILPGMLPLSAASAGAGKEKNIIVSGQKIDTGYIATAAEPVKAVIALVSSFAGTECDWENDEPNSEYSNLSCRLTAALGLGYQCSPTHKDFIKKWFDGDPAVMELIENCYAVPNSATIQSVLEKLTITVDGNRVIADYRILALNIRENKSVKIAGHDVFEIVNQNVRVVKLYRKNP